MSFMLASILPESVSTVITKLNLILSGTFLSDIISLNFFENIVSQLSASVRLGLLIVAMIVALIGCFFGYKFARFFMSITGFFLGVGLAYTLASKILDLNAGLTILVTVCGGLFIAGVSFWIYKALLFILCFLCTFVFAADIIPFTNDIQFFLCTLAGFIVGAISQKFIRPVIILTSSICFGLWGGFTLISLFKMLEITIIPTSLLYKLFAGIVLAILGVVVQFLTTREPEKIIAGD